MTSNRYLPEVNRAIPDAGLLMTKSVSETSKMEMLNQFSSIPRKHQTPRPINRGVYEKARLSHVCDLDFNDPNVQSIPRAGIVPYTFIGDKLYMCFGRDYQTGDLTDFGGQRKHGEPVIRCAVREGNEESRFVFGEIDESQVNGFLCLHSSMMLIIFVPVDAPKEYDEEWSTEVGKLDIREITRQNFENKQWLNSRQYNTYCYNELTEILWLGEAELDNIFSDNPRIQMFAKVRRFIYSCTPFSKSAHQMKCILKNKFTFHPEDLPEPSPIEESEEREEPILSVSAESFSPLDQFSTSYYSSWLSENVLHSSQELYISAV